MNWQESGERLKKIRLGKGLTLEDVQKKTKIHTNILKAIEGDSLTNLSPVYLKGFLKIYCQFLGQDPKEFIPDYRQINSISAVKDEQNIAEGQSKGVSLFKSASMKLGTFRVSRKAKKIIFFAVVAIVFFLIIFNAGKCIAKKMAERPAVVKTEAKKETVKASKPKAAALAPKVTAKEKKLTKISSGSGIRLGIRARENCLVSLKVDGKVVFQRVLEKGRFESWQAKDKMELSLGNAGVVDLEVNGQSFSNLGRKGQAVKNITITRDGLSVR